ncbi:MAG: nonstructural protein [Microvirus sp.]|nr:MAG: nonstructural protein [Microvirus sp.]
MILQIFSVLDRKAKNYNLPFYCPTIEVAQRAFAQSVNDPASGMAYTHPEDFTLYHIGTFDDETGYTTSFEPVPKGNGLGFRYTNNLGAQNADASE